MYVHGLGVLIMYGSPERVVRLGKLGDLQVAHLEIAHVVHRDLELHRDRADLRSEGSRRSTKYAT